MAEAVAEVVVAPLSSEACSQAGCQRFARRAVAVAVEVEAARLPLAVPRPLWLPSRLSLSRLRPLLRRPREPTTRPLRSLRPRLLTRPCPPADSGLHSLLRLSPRRHSLLRRRRDPRLPCLLPPSLRRPRGRCCPLPLSPLVAAAAAAARPSLSCPAIWQC